MSKESTIEQEKFAKVIPHIENEYSPLKKVLVNRNPQLVTTFTDLVVNPIQGRSLEKVEHRGEIKVLPGAAECHGNLLKVLSENGVELLYSDVTPIKEGHTPLFTRDVGVVIDNRVLPSKMRYEYRSVEVPEMLSKISDGSIIRTNQEYKIEGGDVVFLEPNLLLIGIGPRTDVNGLNLLKGIYPGKEFISFSTVRKEEAFHIDTNLGILGKKHLVYLPELVPQDVVNLLKDRDYTFVEAEMSEHDTCCTNILAINDRRIIAPAENKITNSRIRKSGVEVIEVSLKDILSFGGGPHCLTLPLVRD
ncbi:MAG TPA: arginine deiminase family protein [Patescibacteria group bacterium]|nr:arginine deiminase family protein [Patescibacteria group bacterium]